MRALTLFSRDAQSKGIAPQMVRKIAVAVYNVVFYLAPPLQAQWGA